MKYRSFDNEMKERYGGKIYRLSLSSGCTCPNRDGTLGYGGCIFCSAGGSGDFASGSELSIDEQIEEAKKRVEKKLSKNFAGYAAYFQSFTNTYGAVDELERKFLEAINHPEIVALSIATRPDCLPDDIMEMLERLNRIKPVWVELGLQTASDETAKLINRGYKTSVYDDAVVRLHKAGIEVITHVIIGLPGENEEMIKDTVRHVADVGSDGIKLQLLHILKGTKLAEMWERDKSIVHEYSLEEYALLLKALTALLPETMVVHRLTGDAPKRLLLSPMWTADKKRVINRIKEL